MNILKMPSKVSALSESFLTLVASEGSLASMLSEVISQIATFFEEAVASRILAFEK